jgi:DNA-binding XRE family transcriptional regulator
MPARKTQAHAHVPTEATRQLVQLHSSIGTTQEDIAEILGITRRTLFKYYRPELKLALAKANATIGGMLFNKAKGGDVTAAIFWMKTRARWSERHVIAGDDENPIKMEHSFGLSGLTAEERDALRPILERLARESSEGAE